jgi:hypothetical protein
MRHPLSSTKKKKQPKRRATTTDQTPRNLAIDGAGRTLYGVGELE